MARTQGSRFWANSYIVLKSGQKFYLEDYVSSIEDEIESSRSRVEFRIASTLSSSTIYLNPKDIDYFGSV